LLTLLYKYIKPRVDLHGLMNEVKICQYAVKKTTIRFVGLIQILIFLISEFGEFIFHYGQTFHLEETQLSPVGERGGGVGYVSVQILSVFRTLRKLNISLLLVLQMPSYKVQSWP